MCGGMPPRPHPTHDSLVYKNGNSCSVRRTFCAGCIDVVCRQCDNRGEGEGLGFLLAYLWQGHTQPALHTRTQVSMCTHKHTHTFPHLPLHPLSSSVHTSTQSPAVQRVNKNLVTTLTPAHRCLLCQAHNLDTTHNSHYWRMCAAHHDTRRHCKGRQKPGVPATT